MFSTVSPGSALRALFERRCPRPRSGAALAADPVSPVDFRCDGSDVVAPPAPVTVDEVVKTHDVIAVTKPVDAIKLRQFLEPPRAETRSPTLGPAPPKGCHPAGLCHLG